MLLDKGKTLPLKHCPGRIDASCLDVVTHLRTKEFDAIEFSASNIEYLRIIGETDS